MGLVDHRDRTGTAWDARHAATLDEAKAKFRQEWEKARRSVVLEKADGQREGV
jgi:hypothetical protein